MMDNDFKFKTVCSSCRLYPQIDKGRVFALRLYLILYKYFSSKTPIDTIIFNFKENIQQISKKVEIPLHFTFCQTQEITKGTSIFLCFHNYDKSNDTLLCQRNKQTYINIHPKSNLIKRPIYLTLSIPVKIKFTKSSWLNSHNSRVNQDFLRSLLKRIRAEYA